MVAAIDPESTTVIIGRMLSPAFMVNAAALLLLSLHSKFSTLVSRMRALNAERRKLDAPAEPYDEERKSNVSRQIQRLGRRLGYVRRAILFHYIGIALFLLTSFLIAGNIFVHSQAVAIVDLGLFTLGMLCVFLGTLSHLRDVHTAFNAIRLETPDAFN